MNAEILARNFKMAAQWQRFCQAQDCTKPSAAWEAHHVVYEQHVLGAPAYKVLTAAVDRLRLQFDPRNAMRLCRTCHKGGQHTGKKRVELKRLSDENIEFAVELFGAPKAYNYLTRHYAGTDPRVEALIVESAAA